MTMTHVIVLDYTDGTADTTPLNMDKTDSSVTDSLCTIQTHTSQRLPRVILPVKESRHTVCRDFEVRFSGDGYLPDKYSGGVSYLFR